MIKDMRGKTKFKTLKILKIGSATVCILFSQELLFVSHHIVNFSLSTDLKGRKRFTVLNLVSPCFSSYGSTF